MILLLDIFQIDSIPYEFDAALFMEAVLCKQFILYHDLKESKTFFITDEGGVDLRLSSALPGLKFSKVNEEMKIEYPQLLIFSIISEKEEPIKNLYDILSGVEAKLCVSFVKTNINYVKLVKDRVERRLSRKGTRLTKSLGSKSLSSLSTNSMQLELYYDSDERKALSTMLNMVNESMLANGSAYKISILIDDPSNKLKEYLKSKVLILEEIKLPSCSLSELYHRLPIIDAIPFSYFQASKLLSFSKKANRAYPIETQSHDNSNNKIKLGRFLNKSIAETSNLVSIDSSTLNLGTIITGLPGTGKTLSAMLILSQLKNEEPIKTGAIVISPTEEWSNFAKANDMNLVELYNSNIPINFFKCTSNINKEKFYENLAMLMSLSSGAGPYRNSMEKCLLSAFRKIYSETLCPDPVELYEQIEEAIIEQHGKRTNVGTRYTKHGENIRAGLQNLRLMLFKPEFASTEGINFGDLIKDGVIFDLSKVSNNMKQFFYALILNQVYSFTDAYDELGDRELRLVMVLEEAQLIFGQEEISAATVDLRQRIQDFRKKGVGLILLAHSVTDISQSIRRLCQTKLYFRQSSDLIKYALADLGINDDKNYTASTRVRSLENRTCATVSLNLNGTEKIPFGPLFIKVNEYNLGFKNISNDNAITWQNPYCNCTLNLFDYQKRPLEDIKLNLFYVGELIDSKITDKSGSVKFDKLIKNKKYRVAFSVFKKRQTMYLNATENVVIKIDEKLKFS